MGLKLLSFFRDWTNPADFPTVEPDEATVRADLQYHPDAIKNYINETLIPSHDSLTYAKHSHDNKTVLDGITANDVAKWRGTIGATYIAVDSTDDAIFTVNGETYADIQALIDADKPVVVRFDDGLDFYYFETFRFSDSSGVHMRLNFRCVMGSIVYTLTLRDDNTWVFRETSLQSESITDRGGYFTTDTVEGALQEIGAEVQKRAPRVFYFSSTENPGELSRDDVPTFKQALVDHTPIVLVAYYDANLYYYYITYCSATPTAENIDSESFYLEFRTLNGLYKANITLMGPTNATAVFFDTIT